MRSFDRQWIAFGVGAGVPFISALLLTPFIARQLAGHDLQIAAAVIVAHAMFGLFDVFRPLIVRRIVHVEAPYSAIGISAWPAVISSGLSGVLGLAIAHFLPELGVVFAVSAALSLCVFLSSTPFWAILDATGRAGVAYAIRAGSLGMIYVFLALTPAIFHPNAIPWLLLMVNVSCAAAMVCAALPALGSRGATVKITISEVAIALAQNILKSLGDYADKVAVIAFGNPMLAGQYNIVSDIPGKTNAPSQIVTSYYYPKICKSDDQILRFALYGMLISGGMITSSLIVWFYCRSVYIRFYGEDFIYLFPVFCFLLANAGLYAISFFGQAFLRSKRADIDLLVSFALSSCIGLISLTVGVPGLITLLLSALAFRLSSLFIVIAALRFNFRLFVPYIFISFYGVASALFLIMRITI